MGPSSDAEVAPYDSHNKRRQNVSNSPMTVISL